VFKGILVVRFWFSGFCCCRRITTFRGIYCLHVRGWTWTARSSQTSISAHITRCHNPGDHNVNNHTLKASQLTVLLVSDNSWRQTLWTGWLRPGGDGREHNGRQRVRSLKPHHPWDSFLGLSVQNLITLVFLKANSVALFSWTITGLFRMYTEATGKWNYFSAARFPVFYILYLFLSH
jgi:hypothetical protein